MAYFQSPMDLWSVTASATGAAAASASKAAGASGVRHVAKRVIITMATGATVQTPLAFNLRDGATGAGTVLATWQLAVPANTVGPAVAVIDADGLNLVGTSATAMTLEAAAAAVANSAHNCTLIGYSFGVKPVAIPVYVS